MLKRPKYNADFLQENVDAYSTFNVKLEKYPLLKQLSLMKISSIIQDWYTSQVTDNFFESYGSHVGCDHDTSNNHAGAMRTYGSAAESWVNYCGCSMAPL
jgi:hypothetical protein